MLMDVLDRTKYQGPFAVDQMSYGPNVLQTFWTGPNILQGNKKSRAFS